MVFIQPYSGSKHLFLLNIIYGVLYLSHTGRSNVGIDLSGPAAVMSHQLLDISQICTLLQQMGCKRMPQHVRGYPHFNPGPLCCSSQNYCYARGTITAPF